MVTIRNIDETFRFYGSFGAKQMDVELSLIHIYSMELTEKATPLSISRTPNQPMP